MMPDIGVLNVALSPETILAAIAAETTNGSITSVAASTVIYNVLLAEVIAARRISKSVKSGNASTLAVRTATLLLRAATLCSSVVISLTSYASYASWSKSMALSV